MLLLSADHLHIIFFFSALTDVHYSRDGHLNISIFFFPSRYEELFLCNQFLCLINQFRKKDFNFKYRFCLDVSAQSF